MDLRQKVRTQPHLAVSRSLTVELGPGTNRNSSRPRHPESRCGIKEPRRCSPTQQRANAPLFAMPSLRFLLLLPSLLGVARGAIIGSMIQQRGLQARAGTNGSCISAPQEACVSLVGLCVTNIASGHVGHSLFVPFTRQLMYDDLQTPATQFWSDRVCTAAATCAGVSSMYYALRSYRPDLFA